MIEKDIYVYRSRQDQIEIIEKRKTLKKAIKKLERKKKMKKKKKKTQAFVVTNGIRQKKISTLYSTRKSKKRTNRNQSKESLKEMCPLKLVTMKTKIQKKFSDKSENVCLRSSTEILMTTLKKRNQNQVSSLLLLHLQSKTSFTT
jgi:hypothetical protein